MFFCGIRLAYWSSVAPSTGRLYDPGSIPRLRMWAEMCGDLNDSEGFSLGTPVFLALQSRLSLQYLRRRTIKHTLRIKRMAG